MFKLLVAATLLFILVSVSFPLHAQRKVGTVEFSLCNAGKVDVDVFLSSSGKVSSAHVGPADCKSVAKTMGSMEPGYIGVAFSDSRGQWGAPHRLDLLPQWGSLPNANVRGLALEALGVRGASPPPASEPQRVLSRANQTASVQHGNVTVSLQMPLLFRPLSPTCKTVGGESFAAQNNLSLNATAGQRAQAESFDRANSTPGETVCDEFVYALNVEAFADTHEITFKQECDPCDKKTEAQLTPEQRAARQRRSDAVNQVIGTASGLGLGGAILGNFVDQANREAAQEAKERAARVKPAQPVNWSDLLPAMKVTPASGGLPPEIPRNIMVRGTVSRIEEAPANATEHWVDIYVKESPDGMFDVCALSPDIFQDAFGANFRTAMIGKPVELEGQLQRANCKGFKGSIRITLAHQARVVASALFDPAVVPRIVHPIDKSAAAQGSQEDPYDPSMPNYSLTSQNAATLLSQYCSGIYNPAIALLTPEEVQLKLAQRSAIDTEVQKCVSKFDALEVANHRRIAMRYCLATNNYNDILHPDPTRNRQAAYDQCIAQNDTLNAFCTIGARFRGELNRMPNIADQRCPAPRPDPREGMLILKGGRADMGKPVVIPTTGPGLPPILLSPFEAGIIQQARGITANARQYPTPTPPAAAASRPTAAAAGAPSPASVQPPVDRPQTPAAAPRRGPSIAACRQQAAKDHPKGGVDFTKEYTACIQAK